MRWISAVIASTLVLACVDPAHGYWGYVPITPAVTFRPYVEPQVYGHPGVVSLQGDIWHGQDNLADVPDSIRVVTEIVADPGARVWLPPEEAQAELEWDLKCVGIRVRGPEVKPEDPYRPFLHLLIFVLPLDGGYAVHMNLRFFERDEGVKRGRLKAPESWQVITWERQTYWYVPQGDLICSVRQAVKELSDQFTRRYCLEKRQNAVASNGKEDACSKQSCIKNPDSCKGCVGNYKPLEMR